MNGLGNDFVIIDNRYDTVDLSPEQISIIAHRHKGVGFDQLVVVSLPKESEADVYMSIYNADGSIAGACGNATRCVARLVMDEMDSNTASIETLGGILYAEKDQINDHCYIVNMGKPRINWQDIPLASEQDTLHVHMELLPFKDPVAVNMGNPHIVFFVDDVDNIDISRYGPTLEHHDLLPERANIGFAQIIDDQRIKLRVWERGVGETLACGSGACAAVVAACRRGLVCQNVQVQLPGGTLFITWNNNEHVMMSGTADTNFIGILDSDLFR